MKSFISGNANKAMEAKLKDLGMVIACPHLLAYVKSQKKVYHFLDGELQKAGTGPGACRCPRQVTFAPCNNH